MAKTGKHARRDSSARDAQRTVRMPQAGQANQANQAGRAADEQAHCQNNQEQQPAHKPMHQRPGMMTSAYQPYGQTTAVSQANEQWANNQSNREFDMNRDKKSGCRRAAAIIGIILLVVVAVAGVGVFLYLNHINELVGLGSDKDEIELALSDQATHEPYYMLLIGSDSREGFESSDADWAGKDANDEGQADVMILARIDEANKQVTMLSIPRDTPWQLEDGSWTKLNNVYKSKGVSGAISAVSEIAGVPISHFAEIHMSEFMNLVDVVGGITVVVPYRIDYHEALTNEHVVIEKGTQHLNGAEAEVFVRERNNLGDYQDMKRQAKVRMVILAILDSIKKKPVWELPDVLTECAACVTTDFNSSQLIGIYTALGSDVAFYLGTAPYEGDENPNADGLWLCYQNPEGWARVMNVVDSGGDPSTVNYEGDDTTVAGQ